jgi:hypothetical protein
VKAVKSDDAEVQVNLWDQAVCNGSPSEAKKKALTTLRGYMLGRYQRRLWLDARKYMQESHGVNWLERVRAGSDKAVEDTKAIFDILWQAAKNDWFKYHWDPGSYSSNFLHAIALGLKGASK